MPRGRKSKQRARERRRQNRAERQGLGSAQAAPAKEGGAASSLSPVCGDGPSSSPIADTLRVPPGVRGTSRATAGVSCRSDLGAKSCVRKSKTRSQACTSGESSGPGLMARKAGVWIRVLLCKHQMNEPFNKANKLKVVHKRYREPFPAILQRASENLALVFGLELKEVGPNSHFYTLLGKQDDTGDESLSGAWRVPTKEILMPVPGVMLLHGNRASEEVIWEFLNPMGISVGETHLLFGEPRKLVTQDLVKDKYLEYRQVPDSDPPRYEFLRGPRAQAETSKRRVLAFLARVNDTIPSAFPSLYKEALRAEEERAWAMALTESGTASGPARTPRLRPAETRPLREV